MCQFLRNFVGFIWFCTTFKRNKKIQKCCNYQRKGNIESPLYDIISCFIIFLCMLIGLHDLKLMDKVFKLKKILNLGVRMSYVVWEVQVCVHCSLGFAVDPRSGISLILLLPCCVDSSNLASLMQSKLTLVLIINLCLSSL